MFVTPLAHSQGANEGLYSEATLTERIDDLRGREKSWHLNSLSSKYLLSADNILRNED